MLVWGRASCRASPITACGGCKISPLGKAALVRQMLTFLPWKVCSEKGMCSRRADALGNVQRAMFLFWSERASV